MGYRPTQMIKKCLFFFKYLGFKKLKKINEIAYVKWFSRGGLKFGSIYSKMNLNHLKEIFTDFGHILNCHSLTPSQPPYNFFLTFGQKKKKVFLKISIKPKIKKKKDLEA